MKLKKIASLMLAGIMAVSMLAGCKDAASSTPTDPETPVTPVVNAAATVNGELGEVADKVTFTDDMGASKIMESFFDTTPIVKNEWTKAQLKVVNDVATLDDLVADLETYLSAVDPAYNFSNSGVNGNSTDGDQYDGTYLEMYLLNDEYYSEEEALKLVGQYLAKLDLPETNKDVAGVTAGEVMNYSYTGSVAAVKAESKSGAESMWVIMVSITRDSAKR